MVREPLGSVRVSRPHPWNYEWPDDPKSMGHESSCTALGSQGLDLVGWVDTPVGEQGLLCMHSICIDT